MKTTLSEKRRTLVKTVAACIAATMLLTALASCSIGNMHISFGDTAATEADAAVATAAVDKNDPQLYYGIWSSSNSSKVFHIVPGGVGTYYYTDSEGKQHEEKITYEVKDSALSVLITMEFIAYTDSYSASFVLDDSDTQLEMAYDDMPEYVGERYDSDKGEYTRWSLHHSDGKDVGCVFVNSEN